MPTLDGGFACRPNRPHIRRGRYNISVRIKWSFKGEKQVGQPLKEPPETGKKKHLQPHFAKGSFPSGQRGQTVNLMAVPSQVRILYSPLHKMDAHSTEIQYINEMKCCSETSDIDIKTAGVAQW